VDALALEVQLVRPFGHVGEAHHRHRRALVVIVADLGLRDVDDGLGARGGALHQATADLGPDGETEQFVLVGDRLAHHGVHALGEIDGGVGRPVVVEHLARGAEVAAGERDAGGPLRAGRALRAGGPLCAGGALRAGGVPAQGLLARRAREPLGLEVDDAHRAVGVRIARGVDTGLAVGDRGLRGGGEADGQDRGDGQEDSDLHGASLPSRRSHSVGSDP
jgi:hypothetical protein